MNMTILSVDPRDYGFRIVASVEGQLVEFDTRNDCTPWLETYDYLKEALSEEFDYIIGGIYPRKWEG